MNCKWVQYKKIRNSIIRPILIYDDRAKSSRWLQMSWCQIGARPSATTMLTRLYDYTVTWIMLCDTYIMLQPVNKHSSRDVWRSATRQLLCHWRVRLHTMITRYAVGSCPHGRRRGFHDDVIKWSHSPRHWPFVRWIHRSPVNSPQKGQWSGALEFFFICAWTYSSVNNWDTGNLRCQRSHYDVIIMPTNTVTHNE